MDIDSEYRYITSLLFSIKSLLKVRGKAIPLQACTGSEGSRNLRFSDFKTIGT
jgi:hypothetical protein